MLARDKTGKRSRLQPLRDQRLSSVADLSVELKAALARLSATWVDSGARGPLLALARVMPRAFRAGPIGLELRLAGPCRIDAFAAAIPGQASFQGLIERLQHPSAGWSDPDQAQALAARLARWQDGEGALPEVGRYLLVELDAPSHADGPIALPSLFVAPRGARDFPRPGQPPNAFQRRPDATTLALAELAGVWPDPATARALAEVVAAIPEPGGLFAVGSMIGRDAGAAVRVAIRRLDHGGKRSVLHAAGLAPQADALLELAQRLPAPRQALHFEVGPGAERRVGLELALAQDWQQASRAGWPELLDALVQQGLVTSERTTGLVDLINPNSDPLWGFAHIKIAADAAGLLPVVKLYIGLRHGPGAAEPKDAERPDHERA
jgi:hypothetical protein